MVGGVEDGVCGGRSDKGGEVVWFGRGRRIGLVALECPVSPILEMIQAYAYACNFVLIFYFFQGAS